MKYPWCIKEVSSVLEKSFQCVSRKFQGCSRVFLESFEVVTGVFLGVFEASFQEVLKQFQGSFRRVSN